MARILLIDDDPHIREVVRFALEQAHHEVIEANNGRAGLEAFDTHQPDLLILDVMMPEIDGIEVCRTLRKTSRTPILMLSSRDDEFDRVLGLEIGADDYVSKPFSPRELLARVKALLRRAQPEVEEPQTTLLIHGRIRLDLEAFEARLDDQTIDLTPTEFAVLKTLLQRSRKVFSRGELMEYVYSVNTIVSDRTIDSHVRHIREKFGTAEVDPIETVHGLGYRAAACV